MAGSISDAVKALTSNRPLTINVKECVCVWVCQTSRPSMSADDEASNPYTLEFAADVAIQLCAALGFTYGIFAGHSDGCIVALLAAALLQPHSSRCLSACLGDTSE